MQFTCGSSLPLDLTPFDGVVIGYHWQLFIDQNGTKNPLDFPGKIVRAQFLYGHKHHKPCPFSGCDSIIEWVHRRVKRFPQITEWVLVNEFTDDLGVPYPDYFLDDLKRYCEAAHLANPDARLIIGDFKPYLLKKWEAIAHIISELKSEGFPIEVGIQTHFKFATFNPFRWNAPIALMFLPSTLRLFSVPVHFIEASLWYQDDIDSLACPFLWRKLEMIAKDHKVKSFCNWWVNSIDADVGRRMPTFEDLKLFIPIQSH